MDIQLPEFTKAGESFEQPQALHKIQLMLVDAEDPKQNSKNKGIQNSRYKRKPINRPPLRELGGNVAVLGTEGKQKFSSIEMEGFDGGNREYDGEGMQKREIV